MLDDCTSTLALGDAGYRDSYAQHSEAFKTDLAELERLSPSLSAASQAQLGQLKQALGQWLPLPKSALSICATTNSTRASIQNPRDRRPAPRQHDLDRRE